MTSVPAGNRDWGTASELIALSADPVAVFGDDGLLRTANAAFDALFARIPAFIRPGADWRLFLIEAERHDILDPHACQALRLIEERLLDRQDAQPPVEARLPQDATYAIALVPLSSGGFAMTCRQTVDREGLAREESEVEELMTKVLEACPTSLTMARIGDGGILYRSPAATELLGKGRDSRDHFARREDRADFVTTLLPDARVDDMKITGRRPDGQEFPAAISARLIEYRGEDVVVSSMVDLTEELGIQAELARQKEQVFLSEKMSALGELLAGVAHELNNPLSIVVGNAQMLREEPLDAPVARRIDKLGDAAERCVRIVRTFLAMARERPLDLMPMPVDQVVGTAIDAFEASDTAALDIAVALDPDLPEVLIDEVQIVQVIGNLLTNAAHAIAAAGVGGRIDIRGQAGADGRSVRLSLADDGPGVPDDISGKIFDPLFTTKAAGKGTGVGLALCHRILAAHGGRIELVSDRSPGATFVIDLPTGTDGTSG